MSINDMKIQLSRRGRIRLRCFVLSAFIILGLLAYLGTSQARAYKRESDLVQQRALIELSEYVDNIEASLSKGIYANTSPMLAKLSTSLWRETTGAKSILGQLAVSDLQLENVYRFLSQVGEFTMSLNRKVAEGGKITDEENKTLQQLLDLSNKLSKQISDMCNGMENNSFVFEKKTSTLNLNENSEEIATLSKSLKDIEQTFSDFPTLVYDGPFSEHISKKVPEMTKGKKAITKEEAKKIAAKFTGIKESDLRDDSDEDGTLPSFCFSTDQVSIGVTKNGGFVCYALNSRYAGEATIAPQDAISRGKDFLNKIGMKNMENNYFSTNDGICILNYAYEVEGVTYYTDLIKVGVALDNGEVVAYDARGYLMNHKQRNPPKPSITLEEAQKSLSKNLKVLDTGKAVIPTDGGNEVLCYEFHCKGVNDQELLVYIDAKTGNEANILLLLYSDNGILTK